MKKTLIVTRGLPASGKTTWALSAVLGSQAGHVVRVNRDLIRIMFHADRWSKTAERLTVAARDALITTAYQAGASVVISDDTNLSPRVQSDLSALGRKLGAEIVFKDFLDVPLETCIERDLTRAASVGEKVIRRMYRDFLAPAPLVPVEDISLPWCVLVDLDGTLAHMGSRGPFQWDRVAGDEPDRVVCELVADAAKDYAIIIMSGRDACCRELTLGWLKKHDIVFDDLFMRPENDMRKDSIVKLELYNKHVKGTYNVRYVLDDRDQVVQMWRQQGLKVLQVADGAF